MNKKKEPKEEQIKSIFQYLSKSMEPKPKIIKNCIMAFIIGGLLCDVGQLVSNILTSCGLEREQVSSFTSIIMVFLGSFLTGVGIYDKIAVYGGAGTVVPITGFANAIVSPAMEFKKEGFIFGVAAKMFTIAGPVLVYGIGSSVIVGIFYYCLLYFGIME